MADNHKCKSMHLAEAWIEQDDKSCIFNINRTATEQDLQNNHYFEEVGQTIYQVALNIKFCPYCGCKLVKLNHDVIPSITLHDFSKW